MRYWAYFAAKLVVAGAVFYGLLALLGPLAPDESPLPAQYCKGSSAGPQWRGNLAEATCEDTEYKKAVAKAKVTLAHTGAYLAINLALMVWFVMAAGAFYLIVRDQRYRCRVCLHRLLMPVETGSRGFMPATRAAADRIYLPLWARNSEAGGIPDLRAGESRMDQFFRRYVGRPVRGQQRSRGKNNRTFRVSPDTAVSARSPVIIQ